MALRLFQLQKVKQPLANEHGAGNGSLLNFDNRKRFITANIMRRVRSSPELTGMLDTLVTDHFQGPIDFFSVKGKSLSESELSRAKRFWDDKRVMRAFYGQGIDYFSDGSSFGWHVNAGLLMSDGQRKMVNGLRTSVNVFSGAVSESVHMPLQISYLAASTTEILHNEFGIVTYMQDASGRQVEWSPDQVVHVKLMEFNGEIRGHSGLKALAMETAMMFLLKENINARLMNGGSPDTIISLVNASGVSKARFNRLKTALESFSHLKKSHGNMPIDADVKVHEFGTGLKDMEYRELAMFVISEYALALGVPISRIPFMMTGSGGTSNKGELSGNSEDSYQKKINNRRVGWEREWNKVFRKAGFTFMFRRDNLQDTVRETQAATQRSAFVQGVMSNLQSKGKQLTDDAMLQLLSGTKVNIELGDIEKLSVDALPASQGFNKPFSNQEMEGRVSRDRSASKMRSASNNGVSA